MKTYEQIKYANVMNEIKRRTLVIASFINKERNAMYNAVDIELQCLQIRKILELIALSSLVANKKVFQKQLNELQKMWNAKYILNDIKK